MQRRKMKRNKLYRILQVILSSVGIASVLSCAGISSVINGITFPDAPDIRLCSLDFDTSTAWCSNTKTAPSPTPVPIRNMEIGISAQDWLKVMDYVKSLKNVKKI
jgi:hypothetical protein